MKVLTEKDLKATIETAVEAMEVAEQAIKQIDTLVERLASVKKAANNIRWRFDTLLATAPKPAPVQAQPVKAAEVPKQPTCHPIAATDAQGVSCYNIPYVKERFYTLQAVAQIAGVPVAAVDEVYQTAGAELCLTFNTTGGGMPMVPDTLLNNFLGLLNNVAQPQEPEAGSDHYSSLLDAIR